MLLNLSRLLVNVELELVRVGFELPHAGLDFEYGFVLLVDPRFGRRLLFRVVDLVSRVGDGSVRWLKAEAAHLSNYK